MHLTELSYHEDSTLLAEELLPYRWPIFLDSCQPYLNTPAGRYDILSANPFKTITAWKNKVFIETKDLKKQVRQSPWLVLKEELEKQPPPQSIHPFLPFQGGALGYFAYDLAWQLEVLPTLSTADILLPEMAVGFYDWAIIVDHVEQRTYCVSASHSLGTTKLPFKSLLGAPIYRPSSHFSLDAPFYSNMTYDFYKHAFYTIAHHLKEGDCYQVNLAQRFSSIYRGESWLAYKTLRSINPGAFSAFFRIPWGSVLCLSPERFLEVTPPYVKTSPIKGTRPRSSEPKQDHSLYEELYTSEKDRAENLMIVDLLRNDLGKSCKFGSIRVPELFALERLKNVHHMVSHVTGELASDKGALELFRNCFPGGSVTGAPKIRAMEIIENLEPHRRSLYTGSLGYISTSGKMNMNIAIRTLVCSQNSIHCWAGGGIVVDSTLDAEYQETFHKVSSMLKALENIYRGNHNKKEKILCDKPIMGSQT
ncbi:MAG: aminodeoxychorismate synthase component I [Gammaproteobacteria bacterium]|nr:aminodeoxychorismate synthase component I [Gammaproteobacteria bacterium]